MGWDGVGRDGEGSEVQGRGLLTFETDRLVGPRADVSDHQRLRQLIPSRKLGLSDRVL